MEDQFEYWEPLTGKWNLISKNRKNQSTDRYGRATRKREFNSKGVVLTTDILTNNGFPPTGSVIEELGLWLVPCLNGYQFGIDMYDIGKPVKYIHEFQNFCYGLVGQRIKLKTI